MTRRRPKRVSSFALLFCKRRKNIATRRDNSKNKCFSRCRCTTLSTQASFDLFHFVAGGAFDPETGVYSVPGGGGGESGAGEEEEFQRHYVVADFMSHPNLNLVPHDAFFNACRLEDVCYDMQGRFGTVFSLVDSFASNVLGVVCVGTSAGASFQELAAGLDFVARQIGPGVDTTRPSGAPQIGDEGEEEAEVGTPFRLVHSTVKFLAAQMWGSTSF